MIEATSDNDSGVSFLCFKDREELIKTLDSLDDAHLALVGFVDEHDVVRALRREDLIKG